MARRIIRSSYDIDVTEIESIVFKSDLNISKARSTKTGQVIKNYKDVTQDYGGGIRLFEALNMDQLFVLSTKDYFDTTIETGANNQPSNNKFVKFLLKNQKFSVIGHISLHCCDEPNGLPEICLTGIDYHGNYSKQELKAFKEFAKDADEKTIVEGYLRAWWD